MRYRIAIYGLLINTLLVGYNLVLLLLGKASFGKEFIAVAAPVFLLSSFAVYFVCIPWYLKKRRTGNGIIMLDLLTACVSEACIMIFSCFVYSLIWGILYWSPNSQSHESFLGIVLGNAFITVLWIVAVFGIQLAVLGIISGVVGWFLIEKKEMMHI